jgi:hypothetical protein
MPWLEEGPRNAVHRAWRGRQALNRAQHPSDVIALVVFRRLRFKCPASAARFCRGSDELRDFLHIRLHRDRHLPTSSRRHRFLTGGIIANRILGAARSPTEPYDSDLHQLRFPSPPSSARVFPLPSAATKTNRMLRLGAPLSGCTLLLFTPACSPSRTYADGVRPSKLDLSTPSTGKRSSGRSAPALPFLPPRHKDAARCHPA